jgi:hypothetical protein
MPSPSFLLSYSHRNSPVAKRVRNCLERLGLTVLMDELNIEPGQPISEAVRDLVRRATHLIVIVSPASLESQWVLFEIGMAWALKREVWCLLTDPDLKPPKPIAHLKNITIRELKQEAEKLVASTRSKADKTMGPIERFARRRLFYGPTGYIPEIRLLGAVDEFFGISRVSIIYEHDPFNPPVALEGHKKKVLERKEAEAKARNAVLFNGPNVRLIDWRANPRSGVDSILERYSLELRLGPVSWFDFEGLNAAFKEVVGGPGLLEVCEQYLGL